MFLGGSRRAKNYEGIALLFNVDDFTVALNDEQHRKVVSTICSFGNVHIID